MMDARAWSRRTLLKAGLLGGVGLAGPAPRLRAAEGPLPPVRAITRGPKHHWFGYYDKLEFDPAGRYVLGMEVDFEHRSPTPEDSIGLGMVDLQDGDHWIPLGRSSAWCWQQGCMLQWMPGSATEVIWNDREDGRFVSRILDVKSGKGRTVPHPIYAIAPDGRTAVSTSFSRLADMRPGYGYAGVPDPYAGDLAPKETGIFHIDLATGRQDLILPLAEVTSFGRKLPTMEEAKHKFNHLLFSPDGSRFAFLHRWKGPKGRQTRMLTARPDGKDLRIVDDNGLTSHFYWRDPRHILALSSRPPHGMAFYLFEDGGEQAIEVIGEGVMTGDGHCTYLPGNAWILNDTYPDRKHLQHPYLYEVATGRQVALGHFRSPAEYSGEWRCDTHPRFSPDGKMVVIDTPTPDSGRQLHLIDIRKIVG
jgi:hypothetical protein